jgi:lysophospholipase L1-like esterase
MKKALLAAVGVAAFAAGLGWAVLFGAPNRLGRVIGYEATAVLRIQSAVRMAQLLGRRPVVLLGDSRVESLGRQAIGGADDFVINAGISGTTARFWRELLSAAETGGAVYVVWIGINDLVNAGASHEAVLHDLRAIVSRLVQNGATQVLLVEQIPTTVEAARQASITAGILEINRGLLAMADSTAAVSTVALHARVQPLQDGSPAASWYADGVHLNERGNALVRALLRAVLE